jgi:hypothetical protein
MVCRNHPKSYSSVTEEQAFRLVPGGYTIPSMAKKKTAPAATLKGWTAIAKFLGTSPASAQTWAKQRMPVKREGRFAVADPAEVQAWLGQQSHMPQPAHFLTNDTDIAAALKESISVLKRKK